MGEPETARPFQMELTVLLAGREATRWTPYRSTSASIRSGD